MGGGEHALLELFKQIDIERYEISLYVLTGQGELISQIPVKVNLLNKKYFPISVLDNVGKMRLKKTIVRAMFVRGTIFKRIGYLMAQAKNMVKRGVFHMDKLLWKILADGADRLVQEFDLAVAYLEGGSAYYVESHVKAKKKVAFIHINYKLAGYDRELDEECYLGFDHIFAVSEEVKNVFLSVYPECYEKTTVFYNLINRNEIIDKAKENGGFSDDYNGFRILTVGRLVPQKALDIAIDTMKILKNTGNSFRWYVLGEGELRRKLEEKIHLLGLEKDFILLGAVNNPFPYYDQCNLYVQTSHFEGKSIAIEEAQVLGCAILVSDYRGVQEQVKDGVDGKICKPDPLILAEEIMNFFYHPQKLKDYGYYASIKKQTDNQKEIKKLTDLCEIEKL